MLPEEAKELETSEKSAETFNYGTKDSLNVTIVQETEKRPDKVFRANVICDGDPLEIFTDKDGELIFKRTSPRRSARACARARTPSPPSATGTR